MLEVWGLRVGGEGLYLEGKEAVEDFLRADVGWTVDFEEIAPSPLEGGWVDETIRGLGVGGWGLEFTRTWAL